MTNLPIEGRTLDCPFELASEYQPKHLFIPHMYSGASNPITFIRFFTRYYYPSFLRGGNEFIGA